MTITLRIEGAATLEQFKLAQKNTRRTVSEALSKATRESALPRVRVLAPRVVASVLTTGATSTRAYITTLGPKEKDRIAGLLNFGGLVTTRIFPKEKRALAFAPDVVTASVTSPRRYTGKHYIEHGLETALPTIEQVMEREVVKAFPGA